MEYKNHFWGGKREGSGRPKGVKTKPVRLNEREIELINLIRKEETLEVVLYWATAHASDKPEDYK